MRLRLPLEQAYEITTQYDAPDHRALDFGCPTNTHVLASHDGRVSYEHTELGGIVARVTGGECYTRYAHLLGYLAQNGQQVSAGDVIALSGNTGKPYDPVTNPGGTTGEHLHWEARLLNGVAVNPTEYVTMRKTNNHYENRPNEAQLQREAASNHQIVKAVWPFPAIPGKTCISRHWIGGDHEEQKYIERGVTGAQELFQRMLPLYQQYPGLFWEPWNEPDTSTLGKCQNLCLSAVEYARLMHANGFKIAGLATGEGRPEDNPDSTSAQKTAALGPAFMAMDLITVHGYFSPPQCLPDNAWHTTRYRKINADLIAAGFNPSARWVISEAGIDRGVIGAPGGYKNIPLTQAEYLPYIQQHDAELCKDDYVLGCTLYTLNPNPTWVSFDYGGWLEDKLYELAEPSGDDLLTWAEGIVIPVNPQAALWQYARVRGWVPQSQEMSYEGIPYMWGWHNNQRTLLAWQGGQVKEVYTRTN